MNLAKRAEKLIAMWRREASSWRRDLGGAIDGGSRDRIKTAASILESCASDLKMALRKTKAK